MERMTTELDVAQGLVVDGEALGIRPGVEHSLHAESGPGLRGADEIDDGFIVHERAAAPVQADEREEAMLDLVPFARPDRKSTRLNSSHITISYAVFCLKKKTK